MYPHMWIMCVNIYLVYACTHMYMKREIGVLASYQSETYGKGSDSMSETWALHSPGDKCLAAPHLINSSFSIVIHIRSCKQSLGQKNHNLYFYGARSKIPAKGKHETKSKQVSSREWGPPGNPSVLVTIREWLRSELPPSRRKDLPEEQASHRAGLSWCPCWIPVYTSEVWPQSAASLPTPELLAILLAIPLCLAFHYPRALLTRRLSNAVRSWWPKLPAAVWGSRHFKDQN